MNKILALLRSLLGRLPFFGSSSTEIEVVEAEKIDPQKPLPESEADAAEAEEVLPPLSFIERIKRNIYYFFFPPPTLVQVQTKTPEIDLDKFSKDLPLKGQLVYILIGAFFIIAVLWAAFTEIDEVVRAEGEIVPSNNVQLVQSRLPGSVVAINIKLGDKVEKGDVLFNIEDEDVKANFADNEIQHLTALATIYRLEAEAANKDSVDFPEWLASKAPSMVQQERQVFESRIRALNNEHDVIVEQIESLNRAIDERRAEKRVAASQADVIMEERAIIAPLVEAGHEPKLMLINIDSRHKEAKGRAELATLAARRLAADLSTQEYRLIALQGNFRADAEARLVEARTNAAQAEARLNALEGKVEHAEVKAPTSGTVSAVHFTTVGGVIEAGSVIAEIVPEEEDITARVRILTQDVADVRPGLKVRVSLSAYDVARYGTVEGYIEKIATNSTQQENLPPFYQTMVKIPDPVFAQSGARPDVVPGMPVVVDVLGGKRTVLGYILSPIQRAQTIAFREK